MAVLAGKLAARRSDCAPVAGKSTLNRLELSPPEPTRSHKIPDDEAAIERLFVELFLEAHANPPKQIVLDLDATDDPVHGHQEGRFFHGSHGHFGVKFMSYGIMGASFAAVRDPRSKPVA